MIAPHHSLVKYDNPILVSTVGDRAGGGGGGGGGSGMPDNLTPTENILNSILPPREWTEDGQLWVQYVSSQAATPGDIAALQERLDQELQQRQARETGICPVREELYAQCFDELIRQATINCKERGLLLLRVRDEIRMTIAAYQTLYESSIAFGMRKALMAEHEKAKMSTEMGRLEEEVNELERQVQETRDAAERMEREEREREARESEQHQDEVSMLKEHITTLRGDLESILSVPGSGS